MNRREMMQALAMAAAATAVSCSDSVSEPGVTAQARASGTGFLSVDELVLFSAIAQTIIPKTDTPGAVEAGVVERVDTALALWQSDEVRTQWTTGLAELGELLVDKAGASFAERDGESRLAALSAVEIGAEGTPDNARGFFSQLKNFVCLAYYRSEPGATEELYYEAVPGEYRGCVPFEEIGRAYAFGDL
ncbi:MAG: gluconate 2-dehydrogenase subunit 3 family protein [Pseudomonadota bacterium]